MKMKTEIFICCDKCGEPFTDTDTYVYQYIDSNKNYYYFCDDCYHSIYSHILKLLQDTIKQEMRSTSNIGSAKNRISPHINTDAIGADLPDIHIACYVSVTNFVAIFSPAIDGISMINPNELDEFVEEYMGCVFKCSTLASLEKARKNILSDSTSSVSKTFSIGDINNDIYT